MIKSIRNLSEYYLNIDKNTLNEISSNSQKYYRTFTKIKKKPDGSVKKREITEATGLLKQVHKKILKNILLKIVFPSPPFIGGLKRKDNILNAYLHKGKPNKFCTDFKNFFPHINNKMVYDAFVNQGFSADVASILTKLTTYKGRLIQGGSNSTHIAYLAMWNLAQEIAEICDKNQIVFTIYVDDMTFSSHKEFKELSITLRDKIIEAGFFVNHKKTFYTKGRADITGVKVGQNTINVKKEFREKLNKLEDFNELQKAGIEMYYERVITYGRY